MLDRTRLILQFLVFALLLMVFGGGLAWGQGRTGGSITGIVSDESKGVLPGTTVVATNKATGLVRTSVAGIDGSYLLSALPPGTFTVRASLEGFATTERTVTVAVGSDLQVNITMALGTLAETVVVTGQAALVEAGKTEQSVIMAETEVQNLPTNSRDFLEIALLAPGVVRARSTGAGWGGESGFSSSGNRGDQNAINIDGLTNKAADGTEAGNFSQEAVQEFQIITQSFPAEYGGSAGGVVNAVTKSGTNTFQGYGFMYVRDDMFYKPPFELITDPTTRVVTARSVDQKTDFQHLNGGFSAGGPIRTNRTFFHAVLDRTHSNTPRVRNINQATLDAVKQIAIPWLPDNDSNKITQYKPTATKFSLKVDENVSPQHAAAFRYSLADSFAPSGTASGRNSILNSGETTRRYQMVSASLNSFLSDRTLNSVGFSMNRSRVSTDWPNLAPGGLESVLQFPSRITISGGAGGGFGRSNGGGSPYVDYTRWEVQDTLSLVRGKHEVKFGGLLLATQYWNDFHRPDGDWTFSSFNAFLAGKPTNYEQAWGPSAAYVFAKFINVFAQDEWRPTDKVTINAGLRYEVNLFPTDVSSWPVKKGTVDANTGREYSEGGVPGLTGFNNNWKNVAPRLGMTYSPDGGRTLVRAAGGYFYGQEYITEIGNALLFAGPPMNRRYKFTPDQAEAIWNGTVDPTSPFYNPLGIRRLPNTFEPLISQYFGRGPTIFSFQRDLQTPMSIQATFGLDRELFPGVAISGSVLWSRGRNNIRANNTNPPAPTMFKAGQALPTGGVAPYDLRVFDGQRPNPEIGEYLIYEESGSVSYKGASVGLTVRKGGLSARAAYTYSDGWDDSVSITIRNTPADLVEGVGGEWSRSIMATKHRFVISSVYATPGRWPLLARHWQVSGIVNLESGHPFQVWSGQDFNLDTTLTDRPFGVPRNSLWTDPVYNVDMRVGRILPVRGRVKLEVNFEMFNLFNRPHYDNYVDSLYTLVNGVYVPRPDFAAFASTPALNVMDSNRSPKDIGLDRKVRRNAVGNSFQGQIALRLRF
jgi:hypothetical protein